MRDTYIPSKSNDDQQWYLIDAKDKCLGRLATEVSKLLRGKNKSSFTPGQKNNDHIIVINADKIILTGKKISQKIYFRHSGRPGGKTIEKLKDLKKRIPERIVEKAIKGMLPKNRLGRQLFTQLRVYAQNSHPHLAQKPHLLEL
uniref:Large ribosomal subunit protein uL13c n=1 Tax=Ishige okamurae TaxID=233772 RepID=A0A8E5XRI0_9PHAE|nr:ribosomal protein L13 [Ishige okamurae]QVJ99682.1 ribosomal protein L13 [Ishige okamurae]WAM63978.1 50S ribosomal protein L13 [Ishige okamurae]